MPSVPSIFYFKCLKTFLLLRYDVIGIICEIRSLSAFQIPSQQQVPYSAAVTNLIPLFLGPLPGYVHFLIRVLFNDSVNVAKHFHRYYQISQCNTLNIFE